MIGNKGSTREIDVVMEMESDLGNENENGQWNGTGWKGKEIKRETIGLLAKMSFSCKKPWEGERKLSFRLGIYLVPDI